MVEIPTYAIFAILLVMIAVGFRIMVAFGIVSILLLQNSVFATTLQTVGQMGTDSLRSFTLLAIPLFIVTGDLIVATGVAEDLFGFAESIVGGLPSGIGAATQTACGLFAAISGSNTADAAAIGRISTNELQKRGYPSAYAGGMVASASITGILIPPSISYIMLGLVMQISVSKLFIGTIIPGIIVLILMIVTNFLISYRRGVDQNRQPFDFRKMSKYTWKAKYGILVPFIILGGIYSGIFTPTQKAIAAILFMVLTSKPLRGGFSGSEYSNVITRSALLNGIVTPLLVVFTLFSQALGFFQIPSQLTSAIINISGGSPLIAILIISLILLATGTVIGAIPNILLWGPLLIPIGVDLGYNVFHFSIFFLCLLALGYITPPVGLNLYVLAGIINEPVERLAKESAPFFIAGLVAAAIILAFPITVMIML